MTANWQGGIPMEGVGTDEGVEGLGSVNNSLLFSSFPTLFQNGIFKISTKYKSPTGKYADDIKADVFIDGKLIGQAESNVVFNEQNPQLIDYYEFVYNFSSIQVNNLLLEFVVLNGEHSVSKTKSVEVLKSPFFDNDRFLENVFDGIFKRSPEAYELDHLKNKLSKRGYKKWELFDEIRLRNEFQMAANAMLAYKTTTGSWRMVEDLLLDSNLTGENVTSSITADQSDSEANASVVKMNQVIDGRIDSAGDMDFFKIKSLNPSSDGVLTISIDAGHPYVTQTSGSSSYWYGELTAVAPDGTQTIIQGQSAGGNEGNWKKLNSSFNTRYDLKPFNNVSYYFFKIEGIPAQL
ncbi:MAG: hypothetical protein ACJZ64_05055, partial [Opitutales bacterium]